MTSALDKFKQLTEQNEAKDAVLAQQGELIKASVKLLKEASTFARVVGLAIAGKEDTDMTPDQLKKMQAEAKKILTMGEKLDDIIRM